VNSPEIVFCDEPTGNLDTKTTTEMMDLITGMARKFDQTLIIVTHNNELIPYADKLIRIRDGRIVEASDVVKNQDPLNN
jgi:putative ABC transport system ATP-binding protein